VDKSFEHPLYNKLSGVAPTLFIIKAGNKNGICSGEVTKIKLFFTCNKAVSIAMQENKDEKDKPGHRNGFG
jgi:hypothetical protein